MKCPHDDTSLIVKEHGSIEVHYCSRCYGAWLNKDELRKLIDESATESQPTPHFQQGQAAPSNSTPSYDRKTHDYPARDYRQQDL